MMKIVLLCLLAAPCLIHAQDVSVVLSCQADGKQPELFKISTNDQGSTWQFWRPEEGQWSENRCEAKATYQAGGKFWVHCGFLPAKYELREMAEGKGFGQLTRYEIDRVSGGFSQTTWYHQDGEHAFAGTRHGHCEKGVEPAKPEAKF